MYKTNTEPFDSQTALAQGLQERRFFRKEKREKRQRKAKTLMVLLLLLLRSFHKKILFSMAL
jgi:hypothetical protein